MSYKLCFLASCNVVAVSEDITNRFFIVVVGSTRPSPDSSRRKGKTLEGTLLWEGSHDASNLGIQMTSYMICPTSWSGWPSTQPNWWTSMVHTMSTLIYSAYRHFRQRKQRLTNKCGPMAITIGWRTKEMDMDMWLKIMASPAFLERRRDGVQAWPWWEC